MSALSAGNAGTGSLKENIKISRKTLRKTAPESKKLLGAVFCRRLYITVQSGKAFLRQEVEGEMSNREG
jgi:hypothetical protein